MLRRRKADVEAELPGRTVKTYFVPMVEEQRAALRGVPARRPPGCSRRRKRRPLTPEEFDRLQMLLACMRMICDTPAILDPTCRISPKLEELEGILERPARGARPQDHRVLRVGADAGAGARAGRRDGRRGGLAHRLGAAAAPPRRDRALQAGPGLPAVPLHRQRQRRAQPAGGERGGQRRPAVEPGEARAAHRPRLAQAPDPLGDGRQSRLRGLDRAPHAASARAQAGAGRRRARRAGRSRARSRCRPAAPP